MADSEIKSNDAICRRIFWDWRKLMGFTLSSNSNLNRIARTAKNEAGRSTKVSMIKEIDYLSALNSNSIANNELKNTGKAESGKFQKAKTNEYIQSTSSLRREFDESTDLVNAALFYEHLERQLAQTRRDDNQFRLMRILVSDDISDESLIEFAFALNDSTRDEDIVSRIGNHEFVILLRINPLSSDNSRNIIRRISKIFEGKFLFSTILIDGTFDSIRALELLDRALFKRSTNPD
jgi:GGDEF domain-containing protein